MMLAGFLLLLLLTDGESSEHNCSYQDVLQHFNLTKNNELHSMTRPVKDHKVSTEVHLDVQLYAILDVIEKEQKLITYVWIDMWWKSDYIAWNPDEFCGMKRFSLPTELFWKPDLTIEEMTEKDKSLPSPYLIVYSDSDIELMNDQVLVSTCRMHIYRFPFDIQSCNLSFKSVVHNDKEIQLVQYANSSKITEWTREVMRTQYEWLFISMTVSNKTVDFFGFSQDMLIYTISMRRRSVLYIVNFLLPILFFFCLDLASYLISENGGEKLSFQVTVLLAVTVMQLILNEILPSSSERIPLIAIYCIGIFGLMMLSLLETIFVMYLMAKDSTSQDNSLSEDCGDKRGKVNCFREVNKLIHCASVRDVSPGEKPSKLLPMAKEGSSSQLTEESQDFEKLGELVKSLTLVLNSRKEEGKPGYWTRVAKTINKVFFIIYVIAASLFLLFIFSVWNNAENE